MKPLVLAVVCCACHAIARKPEPVPDFKIPGSEGTLCDGRRPRSDQPGFLFEHETHWTVACIEPLECCTGCGLVNCGTFSCMTPEHCSAG